MRTRLEGNLSGDGAVDLGRRLLAWWQRYRQRQLLLQLDQRSLKDIGISRVDAELEASKRFWQE
jgi:uncharacterized protein YjiS (DUF1127 family)